MLSGQDRLILSLRWPGAAADAVPHVGEEGRLTSKHRRPSGCGDHCWIQSIQVADVDRPIDLQVPAPDVRVLWIRHWVPELRERPVRAQWEEEAVEVGDVQFVAALDEVV